MDMDHEQLMEIGKAYAEGLYKGLNIEKDNLIQRRDAIETVASEIAEAYKKLHPNQRKWECGIKSVGNHYELTIPCAITEEGEIK